MKIDKKFKLENAVSKEKDRAIIQKACVKRTGETTGEAVATNGWILAVVPVSLEPNDVEGFLTADSLKSAREKTPKSLDYSFMELDQKCVQMFDNTTESRPTKETEGMDYPPYQAVVPWLNPENKWTPNTVVAINAKLLWELAQALGSNGKLKDSGEFVKLEISDNMSAIRVTCHDSPGAYGVMMPGRIL